jgi:hypothetical protein
MWIGTILAIVLGVVVVAIAWSTARSDLSRGSYYGRCSRYSRNRRR